MDIIQFPNPLGKKYLMREKDENIQRKVRRKYRYAEKNILKEPVKFRI